MKKLIVFDLDGTLAESKAPLDPEMATLLTALLGIQTFIIVAGVTRVLPLTGVTLQLGALLLRALQFRPAFWIAITALLFLLVQVRLRQMDVFATLQHGRHDHEDDQQHEHDVHERRDVDGVFHALLGAGAEGHTLFPLREGEL